MKAQDIIDLGEAYLHTGMLPNDHFRKHLCNMYCNEILKGWENEIAHFQRYLIKGLWTFNTLEFYNDKIWGNIIKSILAQDRLHNVEYFHAAYTVFKSVRDKNVINVDSTNEVISHLEKMFESRDFRLLYNLKEMRMKTYDEKLKEANEMSMKELNELQVHKEFQALSFRKIALKENVITRQNKVKREKKRKPKKLPKSMEAVLK